VNSIFQDSAATWRGILELHGAVWGYLEKVEKVLQIRKRKSERVLAAVTTIINQSG
jgi:hypothetical protein